MSELQNPSCLLCGNPDSEHSDSLLGRDLRKLWNALQHPLGEAAYGAITPETAVILFRCTSCGFRFFNPAFSGSGEFYEELMATKVYPLGSPEFEATLAFARRHGLREVLDIGGGEGAFLDQAKQAGLQTAGVELNRKAAEVSSTKGHQMFQMRMEEIPLEELEGGTELATLFQVVEHVPDPVGFVRAASRLVKPGGYLVVAVPSDRRMLGWLKHDPADWPPHHVSRWRLADLQKLGERCGLETFEHGIDPLFGRAIPWAFDLHNRLATAIQRSPFISPRAFVTVASWIYRGFKLQRILPFHGLSLRMIYRKPVAPSTL